MLVCVSRYECLGVRKQLGRSLRGYRQDPVPREVIEEVLALATRAPASMRTQPWHFSVLRREPLDSIRKLNTERNLAGIPP